MQLSTTTGGPPGKITIFCDLHKVQVNVEISLKSPLQMYAYRLPSSNMEKEITEQKQRKKKARIE